MNTEPTVFVVDDDEAVRKGFSLLIKSIGLNVETYDSAQKFLDSYESSRPGCLVLDIRMPGMSGLELQELLVEKQYILPVIIISRKFNNPTQIFNQWCYFNSRAVFTGH